MSDQDELQALLQKTSRTFALTIPLLPQPIRQEVGVSYLLFRIIDTFEDATAWSSDRKTAALAEFVRLMDESDPSRVRAAAARWIEEPPLDHAGYLELLARTPEVLQWQRALRPEARDQIRRHLTRTAQGMSEFVVCANGTGMLRLETMQDLRDYCFAVAGIVGQMLTELYLLSSPKLASVADDLRERAVSFGEGLQLVNILKDAQPDAAEGRVYLPRQLTLAEVFLLARHDLETALEYTEILRSAEADFGIVAFNALNARLALATLRVLSDQGLGSKLTRLQLTGLAVDVMRSIKAGAPLFP
ncbi:MAG TPA: squalene/phytoene synthase family protein, partial [Polyangiales bacterium]|nr:squalene/phytoene synthase family protein [Polyangiales bacterium]